MTVQEVIDKLEKLPKDKECLLGIDRSNGYTEDEIEVFPVEMVFLRDITKTSEIVEERPIRGYWDFDNPDKEKVIFYVYP